MRKAFVLSAALVAMAAGPVLAVVGGGDLTMKNKGGEVVFSHAAHVEGAGLGCKECHARLYLDTKKHKKTTMKEMEKGKSCGACHNGQKAFSVKGDCARCHKK